MSEYIGCLVCGIRKDCARGKKYYEDVGKDRPGHIDQHEW